MKRIVVYDNTVHPNEMIKEVIGNKQFGSVVVKRKTLKTLYRQKIEFIFSEVFWHEFDNHYDIEQYVQNSVRQRQDEEIRILHCFSDCMITDCEAAALTYKKLDYIEENIGIVFHKQLAAVMFCNLAAYIDFLKRVLERRNMQEIFAEVRYPEIVISGMVYIGEISNFIRCITGNFDSRYFNSIQGTEYQIRKSSADKKKIKSEYQYYHLLPEKMKRWFVMPFDYKEDDTAASYAMERLHMTDTAIKWVHGSIGKKEFADLMDMYFCFFEERSKKTVTTEEYQKTNRELYVEKVGRRIQKLKEFPEYQKISNMLANHEKLKSIDDIFQWYLKVKKKVEKNVIYQAVSVIGHGDPCFANAMYHRSTRTLKFIDPKGAVCEEDLWTNPYYDIAKLSHSVCGNYDFFNNAMYEITIDENFDYLLNIPSDYTEYKDIFRKKVEEHGFDYWSVRLYESSLFLSMLPLHMDYPHKVFGFILNAVIVLKEIEANVQ